MNSTFIADNILPLGAQVLWAKTGGHEAPNLWGALTVHLADTAEIARFLWQDWLARSTRNFICQETGLSDVEVECVIVWLAATHDIGKATPSFEAKVPWLQEHMREFGFAFSGLIESYPHGSLGAIILQDWLACHEWDECVAEAYASVISGHHGTTPREAALDEIRGRARSNPNGTLGNRMWSKMQDAILDWAFACSGIESIEPHLSAQHINSYVQILFSGLVIMADWIASNTDLFPLENRYESWQRCRLRAEEAWKRLRLPKPLHLEHLPDSRLAFHDRFPQIPSTAMLNHTQTAVVDMASNAAQPSLIIVEALMGSGKTEAALLAAETFISKFGCDGVAFLLPTQATSNAMFTRMESWLEHLLVSSHSSSRQDLHLLHGKAALNNDYAALPSWDASWMGDDAASDDAIVAHQWFNGTKRGLLAPFVVGTVDQLLMAALNTRHAQLRHLGLATKVVIIDEVHAYDAYMSEYLKRIIEFLGKYRVPVILLSATLPKSQRDALLMAYRGQLRINSRRLRSLPQPPRLPSGEPCYPLISCTRGTNHDDLKYCTLPTQGDERHVLIDYLSDDDEILIEELKSSLCAGGCICVLRDTVSRAQRTYKLLKEHLHVDVLLVHSRFLALDRTANERKLTEMLGPNIANRPQSLVIVATQVVEQSLDIDFDLLITDIAPIDLLIQRIGRLHRHRRGNGESLRPLPLRTPRCVITGVELCDHEPPAFASGIDYVYQPAVLMRTLLALQERTDSERCISLPTDIAPLVELVYDTETSVPPTWIDAYQEARHKEEDHLWQKKNSAEQWLLSKPPRYSLLGWMRGRASARDEKRGRAAVRDSEESIEVVIVTKSNEGFELLSWVSDQLGVSSYLGTGADIPDDNVARAAALCTVNLPPWFSASYLAKDIIDALECQGTFAGWQESHWLCGTLPLVVNNQGEAVIKCRGYEYRLRYTREQGLETF